MNVGDVVVFRADDYVLYDAPDGRTVGPAGLGGVILESHGGSEFIRVLSFTGRDGWIEEWTVRR